MSTGAYDYAVGGSIAEVLAFAASKVSRTLLESALVYAGRGWPVLPLHHIRCGRCTCGSAKCSGQAKHPLSELVPHGLHDASTDRMVITAWWRRHPEANIGVVTGAISGLLVIDVDPPHGEDSLALIEKENGPLTTPCEVRTPRGGRHLYLQHPGQAHRIPNSVSKLGPGLDVRSDGAYVVAPPSRTLKGCYAWI